MYHPGIFIISVFIVVQNAASFPMSIPNPINNFNGFTQQLLPEAISSTPVITEIVPALQFGDITVTGDLPVGGSIKVKGCFPVYGTVAVEGGLPSAGTAIVNTGGGVMAQIL